MVQKGHVTCPSHPELSALVSPGICALLTDAIEGVECGDAGPVPPGHAPLHSAVPPRISLAAYVERLLKYCRCSPACVAASVVYIERLRTASMLRVTATNKHRLVLAGTVVAAKLVDDRCCTNSYCALGFPKGMCGGGPMECFEHRTNTFCEFGLDSSHDCLTGFHSGESPLPPPTHPNPTMARLPQTRVWAA